MGCGRRSSVGSTGQGCCFSACRPGELGGVFGECGIPGGRWVVLPSVPTPRSVAGRMREVAGLRRGDRGYDWGESRWDGGVDPELSAGLDRGLGRAHACAGGDPPFQYKLKTRSVSWNRVEAYMNSNGGLLGRSRPERRCTGYHSPLV